MSNANKNAVSYANLVQFIIIPSKVSNILPFPGEEIFFLSGNVKLKSKFFHEFCPHTDYSYRTNIFKPTQLLPYENL
jgi:hypothetical protein